MKNKPVQTFFCTPHIPRTYTTIVFDLGGVLVDFDLSVMESILAAHGATIPPALCRTMILSTSFRENALGNITVEQAFQDLYNHFSAEDVDQFIALPLVQALVPISEGQKLFSEARGQAAHIYLLSNITPISFKYIAKTTPFVTQSDGYTVSYEARSRKPDLAIYQNLINRYTLDPQKMLFIDDLEENCKAANMVGIDSIVCDYECDMGGFLQTLSLTKIG